MNLFLTIIPLIVRISCLIISNTKLSVMAQLPSVKHHSASNVSEIIFVHYQHNLWFFLVIIEGIKYLKFFYHSV